MIVRLACALDVPLRERNALLLAAGYAPLYSAGALDAPELDRVQAAFSLHACPARAVPGRGHEPQLEHPARERWCHATVWWSARAGPAAGACQRAAS